MTQLRDWSGHPGPGDQARSSADESGTVRTAARQPLPGRGRLAVTGSSGVTGVTGVTSVTGVTGPHGAAQLRWRGAYSGRLVWMILGLGLFVLSISSSSSSCSLSHTCTTTLGVVAVAACSSYFSPGERAARGHSGESGRASAGTSVRAARPRFCSGRGDGDTPRTGPASVAPARQEEPRESRASASPAGPLSARRAPSPTKAGRRLCSAAR